MAQRGADRPVGGTLAAVPAGRVRELVGDLTADRPPLYAALAARLRLLVGDGRLPVGVRLPAERDLAAALHCSRATVAAAYGLLREQGWLAARQGSGTWTTLPARPGSPDGVPGQSGPAGAGAWVPGPTEPGVLDLAHAAPSAPPQVAAAFAAALTDLPRLLPGHGYHPYGLPELRERIAARYTARGLPTTSEQVLVTAGGLHGVSVAVAAPVPRGGRVLVEHPTYPNALDAITARGRPVPVAVPTDPAGLVRDLTRAARQTRPAGERGLLLAAGPRFGTGHAFDDRLRLPFTQPVPVLERAAGLLAEAAADLPTPRRRPRREREVGVELVV